MAMSKFCANCLKSKLAWFYKRVYCGSKFQHFPEKSVKWWYDFGVRLGLSGKLGVTGWTVARSPGGEIGFDPTVRTIINIRWWEVKVKSSYLWNDVTFLAAWHPLFCEISIRSKQICQKWNCIKMIESHPGQARPYLRASGWLWRSWKWISLEFLSVTVAIHIWEIHISIYPCISIYPYESIYGWSVWDIFSLKPQSW